MRLDRMITVVGAHAEGDVGRVITGGFNPPRAATMFERMEAMERDHDWLRQLMLSDPRGSVNCAVNLLDPADPRRRRHRHDRHGAGLLRADVRRQPDLHRHRRARDRLHPDAGATTIVRVDTPAGLVEAVCDCSDGRCRRVTFRNVASFVMHRDATVEVDGIGTIAADVAYGGMIYCIVDAGALGFALNRSEARDLVAVGERIKEAAAIQLPSVHPENPGIHTINQTLFAGPLRTENGTKRSKNTVVVSPGRLDRCPCGTGTSAASDRCRRSPAGVGATFRVVRVSRRMPIGAPPFPKRQARLDEIKEPVVARVRVAVLDPDGELDRGVAVGVAAPWPRQTAWLWGRRSTGACRKAMSTTSPYKFPRMWRARLLSGSS